MPATWQTALALSARCGFAAAALMPAVSVAGCAPNAEAQKQRIINDPAVLLDGAASVLVAAMPFAWHAPWQKGVAEVSAFYFTSQRAHGAIAGLAARLRALGVRVCDRQNLPQKPLGQSAGFGAMGRNTLLRNNAWGSCFTLRVLTTDIPPQPEITAFPASLCGQCFRCADACPTGALDGQGNLDTTRCIRSHMMTGEVTPEWIREKMGTRLLGCEICQRVCPYNAGVRIVPPQEEPFAIETLLAADRQALDNIGRAIGWNEARLQRVQAQAALAAGNSGDARYLPALAALMDHPRHAVRAHAAWAFERLNGALGDEEWRA
ncbi:MAG: hypothetical protein FWF69_02665 [Firmicutes bacterium]|nr:hypothetical protein [Bacillota bacterium]